MNPSMHHGRAPSREDDARLFDAPPGLRYTCVEGGGFAAARYRSVPMRKPIATVLALVLAAAPVLPALAAPPAAKVLTQASLDKFLKDLPSVMKELEKLGNDLEEKAGLDEDSREEGEPLDMAAIRTAMKALYADAKVKAVLARYGWTENFFELYVVVAIGISYLAFEDAYAMYPMAEMKAMMDQIKAGVHADDLALVKANRGRVEAALDWDD